MGQKEIFNWFDKRVFNVIISFVLIVLLGIWFSRMQLPAQNRDTVESLTHRVDSLKSELDREKSSSLKTLDTLTSVQLRTANTVQKLDRQMGEIKAKQEIILQILLDIKKNGGPS